jgi:signal transduction histidine kinase/ligand-binding sensor domain-containing protein
MDGYTESGGKVAEQTSLEMRHSGEVGMIPSARKRRALSALSYLLAVAWSGSSHALAVERFVVTSWSHRDGLPSTLIYAITQTRDGYLWLGTSDGLVRFDGIHFDHQKLIVDSELMLGAVTALQGANNGALWIGSASGLITKMSGMHLRKYRVDGEVEAIVEASPGDLWVIATSGLYRFAQERSGELVPVESVAAAQILQLFETGTHDLLLGTRPLGLEVVKDVKPFVPVRGHKLALSGRPFLLCEGQQGRFWLTQATARNEQADSVFLRDQRGYRWAGSPAVGLIRTSPEGSRTKPELASRVIESLFEDREGNIWVGANNGLYRFRYGKVFSLTTRDGLTNDRVSSVAADGSAVWVGTQSGLARIDHFGVRECLRGVNVLTVKPSRNHEVWAGTKEGVFRVTDARGVLTSERMVRELSSVTAIEEDTARCLWLLDAEKGLYRWHDRVLVSIGSNPKFGAGRISSMRAQSDGTMWMGFSGGGMSVYRNNGLPESSPVSGIAKGTVYDVYREKPDLIWLASDTGLYRFSGKQSTVWNAKKGLPGNRVLWLQPDGSDGLWLGFSTGIARLRRSELLPTNAASHNALYDFYDFEDGLLANPVRRSQAAASQDAEGKLWFTTSAGIAMIDSQQMEKNNLPPNVFIERVIADRREVALGSSLRFPPLTKNLEVDYTGLSLAAPRKMQFRYELEGYDRQWQEADNRRQAFYTNLPPGTYKFRVLAANNDGVWNERGASIDFTIQPAFHQTRMFLLLCFAAVGVIGWGIYRLRLQRLQAGWNAKLEERLAERTRIAQDLHDELLQSAMGVSLQIELVDSLVEKPPEAKAHLQRALTLSRALLQQGREVLRDLREKTRDASEIAHALSATVQQVRQDGGPSAKLAVEGIPRPVDPLVADDLVQIGRQAIVNAFQHAGAQQIEVYLNYRTTELRLQVKDDGCGMNPHLAESGKPGHYGLIGMRERAQRIGGTLTISSTAGRGTQVTAVIPGRQAFRKTRGHD